MTSVLVVGATGGLGRRTALALARLPGATVRGLVRSLSANDPNKQQLLEELKAAGVDLVVGDLLQPDSLEKAVAGVDVVVSCVMGDDTAMVEGQTNLLNAAKAAGVKKFVASTFFLNLFALDPSKNPMVAAHFRFADILKESGMLHLHILIGAFTEVFWGFLGLYDHSDGVLRYYGSPDQKLDVTTYDDTAEYTARAAIDPEATVVLEFAGDQVSVNDIAAAYKEVHGRELPTQCLGSIDGLSPEIERRYQADPGAWVMYVPLMYQRVMCDGTAKLHHVANDRYPDVKPTSMKEFLRQHPDLSEAAWLPGIAMPPEFYRKSS